MTARKITKSTSREKYIKIEILQSSRYFIRPIMKISLAFALISAVSLSQAGRVPELDKCPPKPPTIAEFDTNAVHFHFNYLFELNEQTHLFSVPR